MHRALVPILLVCGCFSEVDPFGIGDPGEDSSTGGEATQGGTASTASSTSAGATSVGSMSGSASDSTQGTTDATDDTSPVDTGSESGAPVCGQFAEDCCDGECDEGACHRGRCVAFAGAYAEPETCGGCTTMANGPSGEIPPSFLPYLGDCGCPSGFASTSGLLTTSEYCPEAGLLHTPTALRVCQLEDPPQDSDWNGAYVTSATEACGGDVADPCVTPNSYTDACTCPTDEKELVVDTWGPCESGIGEQPLQIHICMTDAEPISFGGAFQTRWIADEPAACEVGNPRMANTCACPEGFDAEALRITSPVVDNGGDLFFCVRY